MSIEEYKAAQSPEALEPLMRFLEIGELHDGIFYTCEGVELKHQPESYEDVFELQFKYKESLGASKETQRIKNAFAIVNDLNSHNKWINAFVEQ